jgi:hypothetical protein
MPFMSGGFASEAWRIAPRFYGTGESFVFRVVAGGGASADHRQTGGAAREFKGLLGHNAHRLLCVSKHGRARLKTAGRIIGTTTGRTGAKEDG